MFVIKYKTNTAYLNEHLELHRVNHPAIIFKDNTQTSYQIYYQNGQQHNPNGPAIINYKDNEEYYLYNTQIQKEDLHTPLNYLKLKYNLCS